MPLRPRQETAQGPMYLQETDHSRLQHDEDFQPEDDEDAERLRDEQNRYQSTEERRRPLPPVKEKRKAKKGKPEFNPNQT